MYKATSKCPVFISTPSPGKSVSLSNVRNEDATFKLEYSLP